MRFQLGIIYLLVFFSLWEYQDTSYCLTTALQAATVYVETPSAPKA